MIKQIVHPISNAPSSLAPSRLFFFISKSVFSIFFKSLLWLILLFATTLGIVFSLLSSYSSCLSASLTILITLFFLPLVISVEEFFHAAVAISRGKRSQLKSINFLTICRGNFNIMVISAGVHFTGEINFLDLLYIASGGPLLALIIFFPLSMILKFFCFEGSFSNALVYTSLLPLTSLIPFSKVLTTDGSVIFSAAKHLNLSLLMFFKLCLRSIFFAFQYVFAYKTFAASAFDKAFVNIELLLNQADFHYENKRIDVAIDIYRKLIDFEPCNALFLNNFAWFLFSAGHLKEAFKYSKKAIKYSRNDKDVLDTYSQIENAILTSKYIRSIS